MAGNGAYGDLPTMGRRTETVIKKRATMSDDIGGSPAKSHSSEDDDEERTPENILR
jgi:hypothetical protein